MGYKKNMTYLSTRKSTILHTFAQSLHFAVDHLSIVAVRYSLHSTLHLATALRSRMRRTNGTPGISLYGIIVKIHELIPQPAELMSLYILHPSILLRHSCAPQTCRISPLFTARLPRRPICKMPRDEALICFLPQSSLLLFYHDYRCPRLAVMVRCHQGHWPFFSSFSHNLICSGDGQRSKRRGRHCQEKIAVVPYVPEGISHMLHYIPMRRTSRRRSGYLLAHA